jgi:hypothetical protein
MKEELKEEIKTELKKELKKEVKKEGRKMFKKLFCNIFNCAKKPKRNDNELQDSINSGVSITAYSGHSSLSKWSFKGLLKQDDIVNLTNENKTTIVLPLACYTTYADSPHTKTLAHQFVAGSNGGAVAVYGAATLSQFTDNAVSAKKMISYLL